MKEMDRQESDGKNNRREGKDGENEGEWVIEKERTKRGREGKRYTGL